VFFEDFNTGADSFEHDIAEREVDEVAQMMKEFEHDVAASPRTKRWSKVRRTGEFEITVR